MAVVSKQKKRPEPQMLGTVVFISYVHSPFMDFWFISCPNTQISDHENITRLCICSYLKCCFLELLSRKCCWPPGTPTKLHVQDPNLWMLQRRWINVKKTIGLVYRNFWGTQIFGKVSLGQWNKDSSTSEFCRRGKELIDAKTKVGRGMKED